MKFFDILCNKPSMWRQKFAVGVTKLMPPDEIRRFDGTTHIPPPWSFYSTFNRKVMYGIRVWLFTSVWSQFEFVTNQNILQFSCFDLVIDGNHGSVFSFVIFTAIYKDRLPHPLFRIVKSMYCIRVLYLLKLPISLYKT